MLKLFNTDNFVVLIAIAVAVLAVLSLWLAVCICRSRKWKWWLLFGLEGMAFAVVAYYQVYFNSGNFHFQHLDSSMFCMFALFAFGLLLLISWGCWSKRKPAD